MLIQGKNKYVLLKLFIMKKYVYILTDSNDNLKSHTSAYTLEHYALDYALELNRLRLANGLPAIDYKIVKLCIEEPLDNELSEKL